MDWGYWITTAIAVSAIFVAWKAREEAKEAAETTRSLQERLEEYEYYPIISASFEPDKQRLRIALTNASAKNAAMNIKTLMVITIIAGEQEYRVQRQQNQVLNGILKPLSTVLVESDEINEVISDSIPFLKRYPQDKHHFSVRCFIECSAPHPKSEKVRENITAFFRRCCINQFQGELPQTQPWLCHGRRLRTAQFCKSI